MDGTRAPEGVWSSKARQRRAAKLPNSKRMRQDKLSDSHHRSKQQEAETAKRLGGTQVPGSGCGNVKGDVRVTGVARIECKTTKHRSFSVTMEMIEKLEHHVLTDCGEVPVIEVEMGVSLARRRVYVVPTWAMEFLIEKLSTHAP